MGVSFLVGWETDNGSDDTTVAINRAALGIFVVEFCVKVSCMVSIPESKVF